MKNIKTIVLLLFICSLGIMACSPNTGKNVGDGCGTWSEKKNNNDTIAPVKGI